MSSEHRDGSLSEMFFWMICFPIILTVVSVSCIMMYKKAEAGSRRRIRSLIDQEAVDFIESEGD